MRPTIACGCFLGLGAAGRASSSSDSLKAGFDMFIGGFMIALGLLKLNFRVDMKLSTEATPLLQIQAACKVLGQTLFAIGPLLFFGP